MFHHALVTDTNIEPVNAVKDYIVHLDTRRGIGRFAGSKPAGKLSLQHFVTGSTLILRLIGRTPDFESGNPGSRPGGSAIHVGPCW